MGTLSKIKALCEERGVKISRLERECGFSNASLAALRNEDVTFDRVVKIANYFNVPIEYFISEDSGTQENTDEATRLYSLYVQSSPEIRSAIETLLKSQLHDS